MSRLAYERAIRRSDLPAPARHIALTAATWADIATGLIPTRFQPSIATLAEATGLHEATVKRHLKTLVADGWMVREVRRQDGRRDNDITLTTLTIPASASQGDDASDDAEVGAECANPPEEVGAQSAKGGRTKRQGVSAERAEGGRTVRHKSPLSSGSTYQSPRAGAPEHDTDRSGDRPNGSTKKPTIKSDLDAAADAAREELGRATHREIRPEWARKVAMSILDAASRPISEGRHAAYVRTAIRNETDLSRFLPTPTASSSRLDEAFLPDPAEDTPAPPALTLHTTDKPRPRKGPAQPPLLAPVADQPPLPEELTDPITTGPTADTVRSYADKIRADLEARRASGEAQ